MMPTLPFHIVPLQLKMMPSRFSSDNDAGSTSEYDLYAVEKDDIPTVEGSTKTSREEMHQVERISTSRRHAEHSAKLCLFGETRTNKNDTNSIIVLTKQKVPGI